MNIVSHYILNGYLLGVYGKQKIEHNARSLHIEDTYSEYVLRDTGCTTAPAVKVVTPNENRAIQGKAIGSTAKAVRRRASATAAPPTQGTFTMARDLSNATSDRR